MEIVRKKNDNLPFRSCVVFVLPDKYFLAIAESGNIDATVAEYSSQNENERLFLATNIAIFSSPWSTCSCSFCPLVMKPVIAWVPFCAPAARKMFQGL